MALPVITDTIRVACQGLAANQHKWENVLHFRKTGAITFAAAIAILDPLLIAHYRTNVAGCVDPKISYSVGQQVETEPGNMSGPTMQGFKELIDQDPDAVWNDGMDCIVDNGQQFSREASDCRSSPRVRPIPMFDPTEEIDAGTKPFTFTNFAGVFVEDIQGQDIVARWIGYTGVDPTTYGSDGNAGPLFKVLRLVK